MIPLKRLKSNLKKRKKKYTSDDFFNLHRHLEAYEFGMNNGNLLDRKRVVAPEGPGLGIEADWDRQSTADFYSRVLSRGNSSITASAAFSHYPHLDVGET